MTWMTIFYPRDGGPLEEYYYPTRQQAINHADLLAADDDAPDLYSEIRVVRYDFTTGETVVFSRILL